MLLSGGPADDLLAVYFSRAEKKALRIDYSALTVQFKSSQGSLSRFRGGFEVKYTQGDLFQGRTWRQKWIAALGGYSAARLADPLAEAGQLRADLACRD